MSSSTSSSLLTVAPPFSIYVSSSSSDQNSEDSRDTWDTDTFFQMMMAPTDQIKKENDPPDEIVEDVQNMAAEPTNPTSPSTEESEPSVILVEDSPNIEAELVNPPPQISEDIGPIDQFVENGPNREAEPERKNPPPQARVENDHIVEDSSKTETESTNSQSQTSEQNDSSVQLSQTNEESDSIAPPFSIYVSSSSSDQNSEDSRDTWDTDTFFQMMMAPTEQIKKENDPPAEIVEDVQNMAAEPTNPTSPSTEESEPSVILVEDSPNIEEELTIPPPRTCEENGPIDHFVENVPNMAAEPARTNPTPEASVENDRTVEDSSNIEAEPTNSQPRATDENEPSAQNVEDRPTMPEVPWWWDRLQRPEENCRNEVNSTASTEILNERDSVINANRSSDGGNDEDNDDGFSVFEMPDERRVNCIMLTNDQLMTFFHKFKPILVGIVRDEKNGKPPVSKIPKDPRFNIENMVDMFRRSQLLTLFKLVYFAFEHHGIEDIGNYIFHVLMPHLLVAIHMECQHISYEESLESMCAA